jgi:hypothetical protein
MKYKGVEIPNREIRSYIASLNAKRVKTRGPRPNAGRPRVMRPCPLCGVSLSATEMRKHRCEGVA